MPGPEFEIRPYANAVATAGERTRTVILVAITVSAVMVGTVWFRWSATESQRQLNRISRLVEGLEATHRAADGYLIRLDSTESVEAIVTEAMQEFSRLPSTPTDNAVRARGRVVAYLTGVRDSVASELNSLRPTAKRLDARIEQAESLKVTIPLVGVPVSPDDIGLTGGVALVAILLWLGASLRSEGHALVVAFAAAEHAERALTGHPWSRELYNRLTTVQVFVSREPVAFGDANPSQRDARPPRKGLLARLKGHMPVLVLLVPLLVQAGLVAVFCWGPTDLRETGAVLYVSSGLAVLIFLLTLQCLRHVRAIDGVWQASRGHFGQHGDGDVLAPARRSDRETETGAPA